MTPSNLRLAFHAKFPAAQSRPPTAHTKNLAALQPPHHDLPGAVMDDAI